MIFAAPLALLGLLALPAIFFLLRLNPPAARRVRFPPLALLRNIADPAPTPRHIPLWLLILRLGAAALVILGLASPTLHPPAALPGAGPILLVIDNGWATAADWPERRAAALRLLAAAARRPVALLATAASAVDDPPRLTGLISAQAATQIVEALQPEPWPSDRLADQAALQSAPTATRLYIADGIADSPGFSAFLESLAPDRIIAAPNPPALLLAATGNATGLVIRAQNTPGAVILAHATDNAVLARGLVSQSGNVVLSLPPPLASQIASVTLAGSASAATTLLLDTASRTILTGLAAGAGGAETPFLGPFYFIRRALPPGTATTTGDLAQVIAMKSGLIILADLPLPAPDRALATSYIAQGGVLLRFAGPLTAAAPDSLSPDPLLPGDRRLGGALTWSAPQSLSAFPAASPLAGLIPTPAITVSRQLLADPTRLNPASVWASLKDGTPLILARPIGKGELISILTSANADWSNLALSGLYPAILARITGLACGTVPKTAAPLPLRSQLSAFGTLASPTIPASLAPAKFANATISPATPAGLYGDGAASIALNLGGHVPPPTPVSLPHPVPLTNAPPATDLGASLIAAALLLLAADLLISLRRRGLLALAAALLAVTTPSAPARAQNAALQPSLGYIRTGDAATDQLSADGLGFLSADVSARTSAYLADPTSLDPAQDDLSLYPLIYWPILANTPAPAATACAALNSYLAHGGLLIIDTDGGEPGSPGSGAGLAPGTAAALARATACLALPPLQPLAETDVLAHCFYILHGFPGRFTGAPVLAAAPASRDDDGVSPVIIGQNGWAAAWARDQNGTPEQLPLPGGEDQREAADRFGTNLVIYALTGSYKADQTNITALLNKLGQ